MVKFGLLCAIHPSQVFAERAENTQGPLCVCTPSMQSKDPLCLFAKCSRFRRAWVKGAARVPWVLAPVL